MKQLINKNTHRLLTVDGKENALLVLSSWVCGCTDILAGILLSSPGKLQHLTTFEQDDGTLHTCIHATQNIADTHRELHLDGKSPGSMWMPVLNSSTCPSLVQMMSAGGYDCTSHSREIMWPSTTLISSSRWPTILGGTKKNTCCINSVLDK